MKRSRVVVLIIVVYGISQLAACLAGTRAASYVHDLTFSYSAILAGLLIGAVGVFLSGITTTAQLVRTRVAEQDAAALVIASIRASSRELRSNVLFALAMVGAQGLVELLRIVDIPYVVWPIHASAFSKLDVLNAIGISAALLEFIAVFDSVRAMFTLSEAADEAAISMASSPRSRTP